MPRQVQYRVIAQEVARRIESGELSPGERLPTEPELADLFGVHRLTARQAMVELRKAGLVDTQHGRGSLRLGRAGSELTGRHCSPVASVRACAASIW